MAKNTKGKPKKSAKRRKSVRRKASPSLFDILLKGGRRDAGVAFILLGLAGLLFVPDPLDAILILGGLYLFVTSKEIWKVISKRLNL